MTHLAAGFGSGVLAASIGIELGVITSIVAFVIVVVVGGLLPRFAFLAGALLGVAFAWLVLAAMSARACQATEDFCGNANFLPLIVISLVIAVFGLAFAALTFARRNTP